MRVRLKAALFLFQGVGGHYLICSDTCSCWSTSIKSFEAEAGGVGLAAQ